jgi:hypothetical protein
MAQQSHFRYVAHDYIRGYRRFIGDKTRGHSGQGIPIKAGSRAAVF